MSSTPARICGLVGDDADGAAVQAREADDDIAREVLLHFEEVAVIDDAGDDVLDVVGLRRIGGNDGVERCVFAIDGIVGGAARRRVKIVRGQKAEELAQHGEALLIVMREEVRDAGDLVVGGGAAQLFLGDLFVRDGADDIRAGDEHVGGLVDHEDEVGDGGRVDSAAGAGAHDGGELRHDTGGERVAEKDVRIAGERDDALLNARAAGVVQPDDGRADAHGGVHDLDDLGGVGFRERAAEDGEVLGIDEDRAAIDGAVAGDEAVAGDALLIHAEIGGAVGDELVRLLEGAGIEQQLNALAGGELAGAVLALAAFGAAGLFGQGVAAFQFSERGCVGMTGMSIVHAKRNSIGAAGVPGAHVADGPPLS